MNEQTHQTRHIQRIISSQPVTDGDGVKIHRSVVHGAMDALDPFLMLDEIASNQANDYIGGFPEHPHRGFETVTYMLEGSMKHRDHLGNEGLLVRGGVQWMTAGRGVLHSEMPQQSSGRLHGFQLWVNLPAVEKMSDPNYQEFAPTQIPHIDLEAGGRIKLIAGQFSQHNQTWKGPVSGVTTQPDLMDIELAAGQSLSLPIDAAKRVLVYVYQGTLSLPASGGAQQVSQQTMVVMDKGDRLDISAKEPTKMLILAGRPIGEPIANWGPFVMNTQAEIEQAIQDFRSGKLVNP